MEGGYKKSQGQIEKHQDFEFNLKEAQFLAEKHDPFRTPEFQEKYNVMEHNALQIKASDTYVMFSMIKAKAKSGHTIAHPVSYNQSSYAFKEDFFKIFNYFKSLVDF